MDAILKNDYIEVFFKPDLNAVNCTWVSSPTSEEFRIGMNAIIEGFIKHNTGLHISDTSELGATPPEDQEWVNTRWLPRAVASGHRKAALVVSPDILTKMSVEDIVTEVKMAESSIEIQYFPSMNKARRWLKESEYLY
ncbi:MAG: hypothetical protein LAT68_05385 [Cyclobacteriaceae bacterium]|nr:hypothetical protein [Cyclobacteriaceae bacterium]MCH8515743.1 hypothetical protein [Cyclobacteriaceae bacterium]